MDLKSLLMGLSFAAIWASAFTATRVVVVQMPPLWALVVRFGISALIAAFCTSSSFLLSFLITFTNSASACDTGSWSSACGARST